MNWLMYIGGGLVFCYGTTIVMQRLNPALVKNSLFFFLCGLSMWVWICLRFIRESI